MIPSPALPIVVGIDGSPESAVALRWAVREGVRTAATVEVVHCWLPDSIVDLMLGSRHEYARASVCMLQAAVATAIRETGETPDVLQISLHGRPVPALLARATHASMLVLGANGHTALPDFVFGGTAAACLRESECPVVIVDLHDIAVLHPSRLKFGSAAASR